MFIEHKNFQLLLKSLVPAAGVPQHFFPSQYICFYPYRIPWNPLGPAIHIPCICLLEIAETCLGHTCVPISLYVWHLMSCVYSRNRKVHWMTAVAACGPCQEILWATSWMTWWVPLVSTWVSGKCRKDTDGWCIEKCRFYWKNWGQWVKACSVHAVCCHHCPWHAPLGMRTITEKKGKGSSLI